MLKKLFHEDLLEVTLHLRIWEWEELLDLIEKEYDLEITSPKWTQWLHLYFTHKNNRVRIIWIPDTSDMWLLVHELTHFSYRVCIDKDVPMTEDNNEMQARINGYFFDKVITYLKKQRNARK